MSVKELIAQHLSEVHTGNNWTDVNIADTIKDITRKEAVTQTNASVNTIAMLLHHISFWKRAAAQRAAGTEPYIDEKNGFDVPPITSEKD